MKHFILKTSFLFLILFLQTYCFSAEVRKVILRDKTELLYIQDSSKTKLEMGFYMRFGPFLEMKNTQGISRVLGYQMKAAVEQKTPFPPNSEIIFKQGYSGFKVSEVDTHFVINFLRTIYKGVCLDSTLFMPAYAQAYKDWISMSKPTEFQNKFDGAIWEENLFKIIPSTPSNLKDTLTFQDLKDFYQSYILPQNSLLTIVGPYSSQEFIDQVSAYLLGSDNSKNIYVSLGRTNIYRNLINSSQYIIPDTFKLLKGNMNLGYEVVCDMRENNGYMYYQLYNEVLQSLLEEKKVKYTGMSFLGMSFHLQRFAGYNNLMFNLEQPQFAPIQALRDSLNILRFDSLVSAEELNKRIQAKIDSYNIISNSPASLTKHLLNWWDLNSLDYALYYPTYIKSLTTKGLQEFYERHIRYSQNVMVLRSSSRMIGTEYLVETNDTVVKRVLNYENNLNDVTEQKFKNYLISILQFLLINPDVTISVHGIADRGEYIKAEAPELESFIAKFPKFRIMGRKTKKITWQRMDMVRALKVVKFFVSNGISPDRITGTGMIRKAESKETMAENRIVYFSFDKIMIHSSQTMGRR